MARTADHDARRQQVAEAVELLVATEGFEAVTVAKTAAAAGISVGLVQHYFPSKDDMLLHAFTHIRGRTERRVLADAERADKAGARIEHILLDALAELLPLDERRRRECRVELAFTGRVVDNPRLAQALGQSNAHLRGTLERAIHNGKECGEVPGDIDEKAEAARSLAVLDGLKLHAYTEPGTMTAAASRDALAAQLGRVFSGPCHHRRSPG
ncbi:TetR family transcriptional regulator C-terminal domain-containing protein [Actinoplanes sp. LDG1-06]|uniref:TetR family transcriptional regulator C-terminal domain-containing protein n=1 Tax=Paractinoplanes ovalisporus TaxID=2810368 RepID=A0ABS2A7F6_9ACTN|nr:TetR family transcriptional regulator C-terminal domain-containing protein [Actinoplanes ovalisporus]MBM2615768.1 TetR family transcriptional regulator C-terminal domain-containing protein [Actinoplanes ovalisporus]